MRAVDKDESTAAAGEYVLGLLGGEERARFERRLATDPALRAEVTGWERRLAPLALSADPVEPPPHLWARIEESLRAAPPRAWVPPVRASRAQRGLGLWRAWALGATAVAAVLAGLLIMRPAVLTPVRLIAVLDDAQSRPAFLIKASPGVGEVSAAPVGKPDAAGRVPELWLLPGADRPPVSLGVLDATGRIDRPVPKDAGDLLTSGRAVAISLEPPGGSPTGQPTGPVAYTGVLLRDPL
jgi:anti-sigma-K factor RskA